MRAWNFIDRTGQVFGRLTVKEFVGKQKHHTLWKCDCACGGVAIATASNLTRGNTTSCGCVHKEMTSMIKTMHGHTANGVISPTYKSWQSMIQRCSYPKHIGYDLYGGRGISFDPNWKSFEAFLSDMGERPEGTSLDRRDVNGNYCKANCRWITVKEQANNKRTTAYVDGLGIKFSKAEAASLMGRKRYSPYAWQEYLKGAC